MWCVMWNEAAAALLCRRRWCRVSFVLSSLADQPGYGAARADMCGVSERMSSVSFCGVQCCCFALSSGMAVHGVLSACAGELTRCQCLACINTSRPVLLAVSCARLCAAYTSCWPVSTALALSMRSFALAQPFVGHIAACMLFDSCVLQSGYNCSTVARNSCVCS